jgi:hypothetical protein
VSSLLKYFCSPRHEAALKKFTSWRKITVSHIERCQKIRSGVEGRYRQSLRNRFSIDWDSDVPGSDAPSTVFKNVLDFLAPLNVTDHYLSSARELF